MTQAIRQRSGSDVEAVSLVEGHEKDGMSERVNVLGLPADVEDLVLARLPISVLYKARPVCKRWNALLTHPPFLSLRSALQGRQEASFFPLVFWNDGEATLRISRTRSKLESIEDLEPIYSTDASQASDPLGEAIWSWLGYDAARRLWQAMKPFTTPIDVKRVVTGSRGLLCLCGEDSLLVVNPMTGAQRVVPLKENVVQLVVDAHQSSFQILCAASRKRTKIYDSSTGLWSKRGRPSPNLALEKDIAAYCDGVLYCVAREERSGRWGAVRYHVDEGARAWSDVIFFPQQDGETVSKAKVIQFGGEVFALVEKEVVEDDVGPRTQSLTLWRLETQGWRLAGAMPAPLRQYLVNLEDFDCVGLNNRLCIFNKSTFRAVACLIDTAGVVTAWHEFPLDSYFAKDTPLVERCIVRFAFEPSLLAAV